MSLPRPAIQLGLPLRFEIRHISEIRNAPVCNALLFNWIIASGLPILKAAPAIDQASD